VLRREGCQFVGYYYQMNIHISKISYWGCYVSWQRVKQYEGIGVVDVFSNGIFRKKNIERNGFHVCGEFGAAGDSGSVFLWLFTALWVIIFKMSIGGWC
jgi:hypothetical protein